MGDHSEPSEQPESHEQKTRRSRKIYDDPRPRPRIYTKAGDLGFTTLLGSSTKVPKWDERIMAYGAVDELNANLGQVREILGNLVEKKTLLMRMGYGPTESWSAELYAALKEDVTTIQRILFAISSWLARHRYAVGDTLGLTPITRESVSLLEKRIDQMTERLPPLKNFILLCGDGTSTIHVARTVCRRAESLSAKAICDESADELEPYATILQYLNRLSDWLFTVARYHANVSLQSEILA